MSYKNYEFTAFSESDLVSGNLACGSHFSMPSTPSACLSVTDNDSLLSGDGKHYRNDEATDRSGQTATIEVDGKEVGNSGQVYAESYHWVQDQHGNKYVLIEIEQEGSQQDYFTFFTGFNFQVPPEGAELTVLGTCDIRGNWVDLTCLDAGEKEVPTGSVTGRFTFDADNNDNEWNDETSSWDKGVEGQTVELLDSNGSVVATTTTNNSGTYTFDDVPVGDYRVKFPSVEGYDFSKQNSDVAEHFDSDANTHGVTDVFSIKVDQTVRNIDAGIQVETGSVKGRLTFDADNNNNEWNSDTHRWDEGAAGQTVELIDADGNVVATAETNARGKYTFDDVPVGEYQVQFPQLDGYAFSAQNSGVAEHYDSDADSQGLTDTFTVRADKVTRNVDAGLQEAKGSLAGRVFNDDDRNNIESVTEGSTKTYVIEAEDMSLDGFRVVSGKHASDDELVRLNKLDKEGSLNTTFDGENGNYDLTLRVQDESDGKSEIIVKVNGVEVATVILDQDSDGRGSNNGQFSEFVISDLDLKAGDNIELLADGHRGEYVRIDNLTLEGNSTTVTDDGAEGVTVYLLDENGNEVLDDNGQAITTMTDANGEYQFDDIDVGNYRVRVDTPTGKIFSAQNAGVDDIIDSDVNSQGISDVVAVNSGETTADVDAGLQNGIGWIKGRLTLDADSNNNEWNDETNAWDQGLEGQVVQLLDVDGNVVASATTKSDGSYQFDVLAGEYSIKFPEVEGYVFSEKDSGVDEHFDSDADENGLTDTFVLQPGQVIKNIDAGLIEAVGSVKGRVFNDLDEDGLQDEHCELGDNLIVNGDFENHPELQNGTHGFFDNIEGWVALRDKIEVQEGAVSGTQNPDDNAVVELDAHNNAIICQHVDIPQAGTYQLSLDYAMRTDNASTNGVQIFINGVLQETLHPTSKDFSTFVLNLDLPAGDVRIDLKGVGTSDSYGSIIDNVTLQQKIFVEDPGQEGVTVYLLDEQGNELVDSNGQAITTITDVNGDYSFDGVPAGDYRVRVEAPADKAITLQNVGADNTIDSDSNTQGVSDVFTINIGEMTTDIDTGLIPANGAIEGCLAFDKDNSNTESAGDQGFEGQTVTLLDADGNVVATTLTNATGHYTFTDLPIGEYQVEFSSVDGYEFSEKDQGGNDRFDFDTDANGVTDSITVVANQTVSDVDAGLQVATGSLEGCLSFDNDNSNTESAGDSGVENQLVELIDTDGNVFATTTTSANGHYSFADIPVGDYQVKFPLLDGYQFAEQDQGGNDRFDFDNDNTGKTEVITINSGDDIRDIDAGIQLIPNSNPELTNDSVETCYDEAIHVAVLDNDSDVDGDTLTITAVNGQAIVDGGMAIDIDGVLVSLVNNELVFDGSTVYADLISGESVQDTFSYTVSDGRGGEATADTSVTFKGATDTLAKIQSTLPDILVTLQVIDETDDVGYGTGNGAFSVQISGGGSLDGFYEQAYCLDLFAPVRTGGFGSDIDYAPAAGAFTRVATDEFAPPSNDLVGVNGENASDNLDLINWIINQDFENTDNGDGNSTNFTGSEIQGAIWALTNGEVLENYYNEPDGVFVNTNFGTVENGQEILELALINGEGFEAGEGDLVGVFVAPVTSPGFTQPFIVGIDLFEECNC